MEPTIADMVDNYECGRLSRRELIAGLSALAVAAGGASAASAAAAPFEATGIHHISLLVSDLDRSVAFYQDVFGFRIVSEDTENRIARLGYEGSGPGATILSLREQQPHGTCDHIAFRVDDLDPEAATRKLKKHGIEAQQNLEYGFFFRDPDGYPVQLV